MADKQLNEKQLQALLRVKRYEQPPPAYFDGLIHAVHRRQREEMLRRPAWRLFFERIGAFFASLRKDWSYVASMACVVMMGVGIIQILLPKRIVVPGASASRHLSTTPFQPEQPTFPFDDPVPDITTGDLVFAPTNRPLREVKTPYARQRKSVTFPVHYVFDTQPSNYEPPTQVRF